MKLIPWKDNSDSDNDWEYVTEGEGKKIHMAPMPLDDSVICICGTTVANPMVVICGTDGLVDGDMCEDCEDNLMEEIP